MTTLKTFVPNGFRSFSFIKANGNCEDKLARWFGDFLPQYWYAWRDEEVKAGRRRPGTNRRPSTIGNVRYVDSKLYNSALSELKRVNKISLLSKPYNNASHDKLRARAIDVSIRQFKSTSIVNVPEGLQLDTYLINRKLEDTRKQK